MSLLMDALKRAEASKQAAARAALDKPESVSAEMINLELLSADPENSHGNSLPDLAVYAEAVDADLASTPLPPPRPAPAKTAAPPPAPPVAGQRERDAVRNAFAAKQAVAPPSRLPLWLGLGGLIFASLTIGGYVWYQLKTLSQGSLAVRPAALATPSTASVNPAPSELPAVPVASSDFGRFSGSTAAIAPPPPETALFAPRSESRPARAPVYEEAEPNSPPIRLTRTQPPADSALFNGHASLQRGDLEAARRSFEQALLRDPNNTDALLALAAIAQHQNRPAEAEALRQRALVANPSDPAVLSAVLSGPAAAANPQATESRLKILLSSQPESAALNFALGNLYARQSRWAEAQQVYFNAVAADADNPDYLFNLAVSLDHLRQAKLAAQHYRLALEASARRPAAFEHSKVELRLNELQLAPPR